MARLEEGRGGARIQARGDFELVEVRRDRRGARVLVEGPALRVDQDRDPAASSLPDREPAYFRGQGPLRVIGEDDGRDLLLEQGSDHPGQSGHVVATDRPRLLV